jgi:hypothetical protein
MASIGVNPQSVIYAMLKRPDIDFQKTWPVENNIEWTEFYLELLHKRLASTLKEIAFQRRQLFLMREELRWWERFLNYCRTGK